MTHDLQELARTDSLDTAEAERIFESPARTEPAAANPPHDKLAGAGDSVRNQRTATKAPGGHDAAKSRDGG
ncbi:MAG: hypothetical protein QOH04_1645 [Sphingomonadales bacterium]|nr:hypothetical protein [Sphingomonadales bacterium]MEA3035880.1 hypothetical protein [Sphingomonadales bacterium]